MVSGSYPKARKEQLLVTSLDDETLIYDTKVDKALCLNGLISTVWQACDGRSDLTAILDTVRLKGFPQTTTEELKLALTELDEAGLLKGETCLSAEQFDVTKRQLLKTIGKTAAILPAITALAIPTAASAVSPCAGPGQKCNKIPCCPGLICGTGNNCYPA